MSIIYFKWDEKFEIGNELIDSQHKIFLMLLNKLAITAREPHSKEYLFRVLHELQKYAEFHFLSEENLMIESNYPGLHPHERIHSKILVELEILIDHVVQGRAHANEVVTFVKEWVFNHIANEDTKIAMHIHKHPGA